jgi:hypothetical protein
VWLGEVFWLQCSGSVTGEPVPFCTKAGIGWEKGGEADGSQGEQIDGPVHPSSRCQVLRPTFNFFSCSEGKF